MVQEVEISNIDLRFEGYRLKNKAAERNLLASIIENGIKEPLQGVKLDSVHILLNGFKRIRCAKKLGITIVPYLSLGESECDGIIELLRISNSKSLNIIEQAKLIDELKSVYKMNTKEIAKDLDKSKAWVSVRTGIIKEMSKKTMDKIMSGGFPCYAYMYIIRPFIRINKIKNEDIDEFIDLVADKDLSIRDIELLAYGYFKGSEEFRFQIRDSDLSWGLEHLKQRQTQINECTSIENSMLNDLETTQKYMRRIIAKSCDTRLKTSSFFSMANLLAGGILKLMDEFNKAIRNCYDRFGKT
jgi:predicted transcriptional regulator